MTYQTRYHETLESIRTLLNGKYYIDGWELDSSGAAAIAMQLERINARLEALTLAVLLTIPNFDDAEIPYDTQEVMEQTK